MTKKDYALIAKTIKTEVDVHGDFLAQRMALRNLVLGLADAFTRDNADFDRVGFYKACGLDKYDAPMGFALGSGA